MGGKKDTGAHVPYEAPNSLSSAQVLRVIDAVAEGELAGFGNGDDAPLKSVFFNDTPVQNADGSFNFKGVEAFFVRGTPDQPYIPGFAATERTVAVGAAVKRNTPVVRAVTAAQTDRLRVTVGVERNLAVQDNGDTLAANTELVVELVGTNGVQAARSVFFGEKSSGAYYQDVDFDALPPVPFNVRVRRNTPDSDSDRVINNTFFASYVEIADIKLSYPHTALAALKIDSDQFGNQIPRRNYLLRGKLLQVPSNYNPETRQYAGLWDGSFKTAWSNNPAWVFYDLLTNPRYSTLARRLTAAEIDKWALYEIAKYCDAPVPDGFGGQEPRFVCNAYLTDARQAADVLADLAAAFCALPVWDGQRLSLRADTAAEPVAQYGNANVADGAFAYAGAALKAVHTAVHVRYADKHDGWRMKTEYLADDAAIARYGLNIKAVTAFGCDSRGQAVRFGEWLLQTELRQQDTVTFTVGREGLRHLPHDIIRIADNDYAGADIGGRVKAVSGSLLTLDRAVTASAGQILHYAAADGSLKNVRIAAQTAPDTLRVEAAADVAENAVWALAGQVKPRLYRALSVRENTEDGTYTVTALRHDPAKYAAVDNSAAFERTTLHGQTPELGGGEVRGDNGALVLTWDGGGADGGILAYDIKIYRNGSLYRHIPDAQTAEIRLENLPDGDYRADIRARNARGEWSATLQKAWRIHYAIEGLRATGKTLAIELAWNLPETVTGKVQTELRYGTRADFQAALPLAKLPYPQNGYTLTGVAVTDTYYFWARLADADGRAGEWTAAVVGRADPNPAPIVAQIRGAVEKSSLSQSLINQLRADDTAAENRAKASAAADAANKVTAEAQARAAALRSESGRLHTAITAAAQSARAALDGTAAELTRTAQQLGNRITATETLNREQASAIQTVTAAQARTAAALETERTARAEADRAEAQARQILAGKVDGHSAALAEMRETKADTTQVAALARQTLSAEWQNDIAAARTQAAADLLREQQTRAAADEAHTREINAAKARLGTAESGIGELRQTAATQQRALAETQSSLTARIDGVANELHARVNLLTANIWEAGNIGANGADVNGYAHFWRIRRNAALNVDGGAHYVLQLHGGEYSLQWSWYGANGQFLRGDWAANITADRRTAPDNAATLRLSIRNRRHSVYDLAAARPRLYRDLAADTAAVAAGLEAYKRAQANTDAAQTAELTAAKSQIGQHNAALEQMRSSKADKAEVSAQMQTTLQAAARDAQSKADAAQNAAIGEAQRLNTAATARINSLETTLANDREAAASQISTLSAQLGGKADLPKQAVLDLTALNADTWYPVTFHGLGPMTTAVFRVSQDLVVGQHNPPWATHGSRSFALICEWEANGHGWGTVEVQRTIRQFDYGWTQDNRSPVLNIGQLTNSNIEYCLLRGGAKYRVQTPQDMTAAVRTAAYSVHGQTVSPLTAYDAALVPKATLKQAVADITAEKTARIAADNAQTAEINAAKSQIGGNRAAIDGIRSSKADKTEVAALARTSLQSEWRGYTDAAKNATDARLNTLEQTVSRENGATANRFARVEAAVRGVGLIADTRNDNRPPSWYRANHAHRTAEEFKTAAVLGLSDTGGTFVYLQTAVKWGDATGGAVHQSAAGDNGKRFARHSVGDGWSAWTETETVSGVQNKLAAKADLPKQAVLDLTALNADTWYPVTFHGLGPVTTAVFRVSQDLVPGQHNPPWATHGSRSFALICEWEANGHGWGTVEVQRTIRQFDYGWTQDNRSPVLNIGQLTNSNIEYCLLRGGAKYRVQTPQDMTAAVRTAAYSVHGQTVSPLTAYDAALVPKATLRQAAADVQTTQTAVAELNGKVQAMYTVRVQAVGSRKAVAGLALGADGATGDSQFLVMADKLALVRPGSSDIKAPFVVVTQNGRTQLALAGDMIADGLIHGKHIAAGQTLQAPVINGGSLNIGGGRFTVSNTGQVAISAASGNVGTKINNKGVFVYNERGQVVVELGEFL